MERDYQFVFGPTVSRAFIREQVPSLDALLEEAAAPGALLVCDAHGEYLARKIRGSRSDPLYALPPGEAAKTWASVECILAAACRAGLGRDGLFVGIGGGVVTDLASFAASIYMRGAQLCLVSTTLLGMADAALGGKTGFDLFGIKNLAGTFYPAARVYLPLEALQTLPPEQWKSGMGELLKTAVLEGSAEALDQAKALLPFMRDIFAGRRSFTEDAYPILADLIGRSVLAKGRIVEADPRESSGGSGGRALLNLGHTFGHALEAAAGLGNISHGEAVAWGLVRACELGFALGITPKDRAREIMDIVAAYGYETASPHPLMKDAAFFIRALAGDKKKKAGALAFVVPNAAGAELASEASLPPGLLNNILTGGQDI
ncbi:MAG: 3-dehydroquinate synthase [Treponema sp.]|jgi:3-dehydroquinate synthase|nr:3-dehydroquinate synthase [Treponema sp.]